MNYLIKYFSILFSINYMNKYYDKYLKYKKKYLNLRSQLAGTSFATPASPKFRELSPAMLNLRTPISTPISTPPASPNLRNQNIIRTDSRSKDEINKEIIELINEKYRGNWILTGSLAIIKYQEALNIASNLVANDVDVLKVCEGHPNLWDIKETKIGDDYIKVQKTIEKSVTFSNGYNSFDVTCVGKLPKHNLINGIRVLSPIILLDYYNFNNRDQDIDKIIMLEQIIKTIKQGYTKFIL